MRKFALLGASALILAFLGVAGASAEPFNPVTGYSNHSSSVNSAAGNAILEQYHEGK